MLKSLIMGALALGLTIPTLTANTISIQPTGFNGGLSGGEFKATTDNLGTFITFCLEKSEHIKYGTTYNYVENTGAVQGGGNHVVSPGFDRLSQGTAYLFGLFTSGNLLGYLANHNVNAGYLQNAIWALEDEVTLASQAANPYLNLAISHFGGFGAAQADDSGNGGVHVLNIFGPGSPNDGSPGVYRQDVLFVPDGGATLMLLGSALTGLALIRRKF